MCHQPHQVQGPTGKALQVGTASDEVPQLGPAAGGEPHSLEEAVKTSPAQSRLRKASQYCRIKNV